jgi:hypothetical protein
LVLFLSFFSFFVSRHLWRFGWLVWLVAYWILLSTLKHS